MTLTFINKMNRYCWYNNLIVVFVIISAQSKFVNANDLTYSPDQWPRHWNALINQAPSQQNTSGSQSQRDQYENHRPLRSPMWGVMPSAKKSSRRSMWPEYNTRAHLHSAIYAENYYSGFPAYGLPIPMASSLVMPYGAPLLAPGIMPGINPVGYPYAAYPYRAYPYASPFIGGFPGQGHLW